MCWCLAIYSGAHTTSYIYCASGSIIFLCFLLFVPSLNTHLVILFMHLALDVSYVSCIWACVMLLKYSLLRLTSFCRITFSKRSLFTISGKKCLVNSFKLVGDICDRMQMNLWNLVKFFSLKFLKYFLIKRLKLKIVFICTQQHAAKDD